MGNIINMINAIILAGGNGTRIKSKEINKVALPFLGKPIVLYGVELFEKIASKTVVVIGAFEDSVKEALKDKNIIYVRQEERLGTAHAVKVGISALKDSPDDELVLVGYGDHLMFYKEETIREFINHHLQNRAVVSFITTKYHDPNYLAWGRIERDSSGNVADIVEQKDATDEQRKIKEVNAGFYCFSLGFLRKHINMVEKSPVSGEYYITDLVKYAVKEKLKVSAVIVRFREVGIGINRQDELEESQKIYTEFNESKQDG
jgi:bifunctional UDP-N-acetylglucosamine pyrophosphorylase / glucosamine-1-phosphate N-acetyltransferase